jgi:hypothetical protein
MKQIKFRNGQLNGKTARKRKTAFKRKSAFLEIFPSIIKTAFQFSFVGKKIALLEICCLDRIL